MAQKVAFPYHRVVYEAVLLRSLHFVRVDALLVLSQALLVVVSERFQLRLEVSPVLLCAR
jgi:hypothetical protein